MEITILGSGNGVPNLRRGAPAHTVKVGREILLFDSGPGTLHRLAEAGVDVGRLGRIFYTHFHLDHIADLPAILFVRRSPLLKKVDDLTLHGPQGLADHVQKLEGVYGKHVTGGDRYHIKVEELSGPVEGEGWYVTSSPVKHSPEAVGYRIEDEAGHAICYSGDTGYCPEIVELARHAEVLLAECTAPDPARDEGHLTPTLAGRIAREAEVRRLVLVHLSSECDRVDLEGAVRREYKRGDFFVGADLMRLAVG